VPHHQSGGVHGAHREVDAPSIETSGRRQRTVKSRCVWRTCVRDVVLPFGTRT